MPVTVIDKNKHCVDESKDDAFTPQQVEFLDKMELGRNEVVGKMKHDRGKGHTGGPSLRRAHKKRLTYVNGKPVWVPLR